MKMSRTIAHHRSAAVRRPHFHRWTLFLAVSGCCGLFYLMQLVGPMGAIMLTVGALLIALHVVGNALGTSLGDQAAEQVDPIDDPLVPPPTASRVKAATAPPGELHGRKRLGWRVVVCTLLGAAAGAGAGGWAYGNLAMASEAGVIVGSISTAVLGGFLAFLSSTFLMTILSAIREP